MVKTFAMAKPVEFTFLLAIAYSPLLFHHRIHFWGALTAISSRGGITQPTLDCSFFVPHGSTQTHAQPPQQPFPGLTANIPGSNLAAIFSPIDAFPLRPTPCPSLRLVARPSISAPRCSLLVPGLVKDRQLASTVTITIPRRVLTTTGV